MSCNIQEEFFLYLRLRLLISTRTLPSRYTRGIYRDVYSGLLQRSLQLIPFYHFSLEYRSVFGQYFRSVAKFNSLGHLLEVLGRYV